MPLPRPGAKFDYAAVIERIVAPERRGRIEIFDPEIFTETGIYDVHTDTGGERVYPAIWPLGPIDGLPGVPARIIALRMEESQLSKDEWGTKRGFHFDIALDPALPFLHKGLGIRVVDGGNDPSLESLRFTIESASNSTSANQRSIIAVTEGAEVAP